MADFQERLLYIINMIVIFGNTIKWEGEESLAEEQL